MKTLEQTLALIDELNYVVNQFYQVHHRGPWHMVVGTPWAWTVTHFDGDTPAECATNAARALVLRGEAKPHTPAQQARERVRVAKASGVKRKRIKNEPVQRPARVRIGHRGKLFQ